MQFKDPLPINPFTSPVKGEVKLPGSKSITNRALILAALCKKPVTLTGALFSEDTHIMTKALNDLGFEVTSDEAASSMHVCGQAKAFKNEDLVELFVGNAGTAARFLTALCAAAPRGTYYLDGVPQMHRRPIRGLIDALRALGADIRCPRSEGFFPLEISAHGLLGGNVTIDASESSQMLSALLMAMPLAKGPAEIRLSKAVREPFVNMTVSMMKHQFGFDVVRDTQTNIISTRPIPIVSEFSRTPSLVEAGGTYSIEADASSASYFMALPIVTSGKLTLLKMPFPFSEERANLQGDGKKFIDVIERIGAIVEPHKQSKRIESLFGWFTKASFTSRKKMPKVEFSSTTEYYDGVTVEYAQTSRNKISRGKGITQEFREFSDTFLTIAAIAPLLKEKTVITGIEHTKKQETNRMEAMARQLEKIFGKEKIIQKPDSLEIEAASIGDLRRKLKSQKEIVTIKTYNDHRVAMSFAILGCFDLLGNGQPWLRIENPGCCAKTFPNFFEILGELWKHSHTDS